MVRMEKKVKKETKLFNPWQWEIEKNRERKI